VFPSVAVTCRDTALAFVGVGLGVGVVFFENFIASASIFTASNEEHMVDALAPRADEGRGKLR
jgi:hypothetical protein